MWIWMPRRLSGWERKERLGTRIDGRYYRGVEILRIPPIPGISTRGQRFHVTYASARPFACYIVRQSAAQCFFSSHPVSLQQKVTLCYNTSGSGSFSNPVATRDVILNGNNGRQMFKNVDADAPMEHIFGAQRKRGARITRQGRGGWGCGPQAPGSPSQCAARKLNKANWGGI